VGRRLLGRAAHDALAAELLAVLDGFHADHPLEPGAALQWLRSRLRAPEAVAIALVAELASVHAIIVDGGMARRPEFVPRLTTEQRRLRDALLAALGAAGHEPPAIDELAPMLGAAPAELLTLARMLARDGELVAVEASRYYPTPVVETLLARLRTGMASRADYAPSELRDLLGFSRKFLIPFLEFCDREGHTVRDGSGRRRRAGT
jgi:selenocysteine-specific elongation factor